MHKLVILFLILIALFFFFQSGKRKEKEELSEGTGPGYIPAFQGHPQIGVRM